MKVDGRGGRGVALALPLERRSSPSLSPASPDLGTGDRGLPRMSLLSWVAPALVRPPTNLARLLRTFRRRVRLPRVEHLDGPTGWGAPDEAGGGGHGTMGTRRRPATSRDFPAAGRSVSCPNAVIAHASHPVGVGCGGWSQPAVPGARHTARPSSWGTMPRAWRGTGGFARSSSRSFLPSFLPPVLGVCARASWRGLACSFAARVKRPRWRLPRLFPQGLALSWALASASPWQEEEKATTP